MASTQALSAATQDRKARLAQLKSLKRKQPETEQEIGDGDSHRIKSPRSTDEDDIADVSAKYLSGRNYDPESKGPRLGFENVPTNGQETLEMKAKALEAETIRQAEEEEKTDKPLDLFKLQPKKPNWDLKRDLESKMSILNVRTDNAIARLVRERIAGQQKAAMATKERGTADQAEVVGMDGADLVEATNVREREDLEEAKKEREEEEEIGDD